MRILISAASRHGSTAEVVTWEAIDAWAAQIAIELSGATIGRP